MHTTYCSPQAKRHEWICRTPITIGTQICNLLHYVHPSSPPTPSISCTSHILPLHISHLTSTCPHAPFAHNPSPAEPTQVVSLWNCKDCNFSIPRSAARCSSTSKHDVSKTRFGDSFCMQQKRLSYMVKANQDCCSRWHPPFYRTTLGEISYKEGGFKHREGSTSSCKGYGIAPSLPHVSSVLLSLQQHRP